MITVTAPTSTRPTSAADTAPTSAIDTVATVTGGNAAAICYLFFDP